MDRPPLLSAGPMEEPEPGLEPRKARIDSVQGRESSNASMRGSRASQRESSTPTSAVPLEARRLAGGVVSYFALTFLGTGGSATLAVLLWSDMGLHEVCLRWLMARYHYRIHILGSCVGIVCLLYLLDFFCPPHLPGKFMRLWSSDVWVGRLVFCLGLGLIILSVSLMAKIEPSLPLIITICLGPVITAVVWIAFPPVHADVYKSMRTDNPREDTPVRREDTSRSKSKLRVLNSILEQETDEESFYKAAVGAFMLTAALVLAAWLVWVESLQSHGTRAGEVPAIAFILWIAPLVVAASNLVFGLFALMRVLLHRAYLKTDETRNRLSCELDSTVVQGCKEAAAALAAYRAKDLQEVQLRNARRLSTIIKVVICILVLIVGLLSIMGQFVYIDKNIAGMVIELAAVFLLGFCIFAYMSFRRVVLVMQNSVKELPAVKLFSNALQKDWACAVLCCLILPAVPVGLLLSAANQAVRRCRGLHTYGIEDTAGSVGWPRRFLTSRIADLLEYTNKWPWRSITSWCYIVCCVYVCFSLSPLFVNVGFAWLHAEMQDWPFGGVVMVTFLVGVITFMLPPMPGAFVYIFGGLVLAGSCPWGFWPGAILNLLISLLMKLVACAVQQKCIGELVGRSVWVRQSVGVHRMGIRCVEAILRSPGWSVSKVAILCGGPDWPTSVLAGILKLSLAKCELGTLPVMGFIAPCGLTGSLYLKRGTSELWTRLANIMFGLSTCVSLLLMTTVAWALQSQLAERSEELSRPRPEDVHLHWLDHKANEVRRRSAVSWAEVPMCVGLLYGFGAFLHIGVFHAFLWGFRHLFGNFRITDDIYAMAFFGQGGVVTPGAVRVLALYMLGWVCNWLFSLWHWVHSREPRAQALRELTAMEVSWKEQWLRDTRRLQGGSTPKSKQVSWTNHTSLEVGTLAADSASEAPDNQEAALMGVSTAHIGLPTLQEEAGESQGSSPKQAPEMQDDSTGHDWRFRLTAAEQAEEERERPAAAHSGSCSPPLSASLATTPHDRAGLLAAASPCLAAAPASVQSAAELDLGGRSCCSGASAANAFAPAPAALAGQLLPVPPQPAAPPPPPLLLPCEPPMLLRVPDGLSQKGRATAACLQGPNECDFTVPLSDCLPPFVKRPPLARPTAQPLHGTRPCERSLYT